MKPLVRRLIRLAGVAVVVGGLYYLGGRYLWPSPVTSTIQTVGVIEAPEVNITSRIAGRITRLDLLEGDHVETGQVVCRIEDVDLRNQLAKAKGDLATAQADLRQAEFTMNRDRALFQRQVISAKERDDANADLGRKRAAVVAAKANVQYYNDQVADTVIRSPITGIVVSKALQVGEWVTPGTPDSRSTTSRPSGRGLTSRRPTSARFAWARMRRLR
jgi:RND family efflux transporter MFP subunit